MINVISQSTSERENETHQLFQECKVYMDNSYSLSHAVRIVKDLSYTSFHNSRWYKDLREYAKSQGYDARV